MTIGMMTVLGKSKPRDYDTGTEVSSPAYRRD